MKHRLQIIGTYLEDLEQSLRIRGVEIDSVIRKVNPVTIMFEPDETKQECCDLLKNDVGTCLDIRKNFKNLLSRDSESFESNLLLHACGEPVRYQNQTEYILIYNSYINAKLLLDNNVLYTYKKLPEGILDTMVQNGGVLKDFTYLKTIDWKKYFDRFIEAVQEQYDAKHIILLKVNVGPWFLNEFGIGEFSTDYREYMELASEMDSYFAQKTQCICLNDLATSVSDRNPGCLAPFALRSKDEFERIADKLCEIMDGAEISAPVEEKKEPFFDRRTDEERFEYYSNFGVSDINDLIDIYKLYQLYAEAWDFTRIVEKIITDKTTVLAKRVEETLLKNKKYLGQYPYISKDVLGWEKSARETYFKLEHGFYFKVSLLDKPAIDLLIYEKTKRFTYDRLLGKDMYCPVHFARALCGDLSFYIARARAGYGNSQIKLKFHTKSEFIKYLYLYEWEEILECEKFLFEVVGQMPVSVKEYQSRTDLSFLFKGNARIFILRAGFADQIKFYMRSKEVTNGEDDNVWYDDTAYYRQRIQEGLELPKVIQEPIEKKLFTNVFSKLLLKNNFGVDSCKMHAADMLYEKGLHEILFVTDYPRHMEYVKKANSILIDGEDKLKTTRNLSNPVLYFYFNPAIVSREYYKKYICFPLFDTIENIRLSEEMLSCDAIVLHIRRGDFITLGNRSPEAHFYYESLNKLKEIDDYKNKRLYVFSDDILWCKENKEALGFSLFPEAEVHFIDHNKGENAFWDMKLISLGKIIIAPCSGFSVVGTMLSEQREVFMCSRIEYIEQIERLAYKNKYDVGKYCREYDYLKLKKMQ